jgi:hypothetical protein
MCGEFAMRQLPLLAALASLGLATAANAASVTINGVTLTEISPLNTNTFDNNTVGAQIGASTTCYTSAGCVGINFTTTGSVANGLTPGVSAPPAGDASNYLWGINTSGDSPNGASVVFDQSVTSFDIFWGSIDAQTTSNGSNRYDNTLYIQTLVNGVTGTELVSAGFSINGFGDQFSANDNHWFQVSLASGGSIDAFLATSPQNAFEFDMPGAPEASTWVMLLAGFAGLGFAGYRKTRSGQRVAVAV